MNNGEQEAWTKHDLTENRVEVIAHLKALLSRSGIQKGGLLLVAVSGGVDSMALLHALLACTEEMDMQLVVGHVDHGFRGQESKMDAEFVRDICTKWGVACHVKRLNLPAQFINASGNMQDIARTQRYAFLRQLTTKLEAKAIVLAHHADDQAETVLLHLLRGSGSEGLRGMLPVTVMNNVMLIRPFLQVRKAALLAYCEMMDVPWREDSSNAKLDYQRNDLRLRVMPLLQRFNPKLIEAIGRTADIMREECVWLDEETEKAASQLLKQDMDGVAWIFPAERFSQKPVALQRRLIKLILNYLSAACELAVVDRICQQVASAVLNKSGSLQHTISGSITMLVSYGKVRIGHSEFSTSWAVPLLGKCGSAEPLKGLGIQWRELTDVRNEASSSNPWTVILPLHRPEDGSTWVIRSRKSGDRLKIHGMSGRKKLQDLFVDEKVPVWQRDRMPIITDSHDRIIAVLGIPQATPQLTLQGARLLIESVQLDIGRGGY